MFDLQKNTIQQSVQIDMEDPQEAFSFKMYQSDQKRGPRYVPESAGRTPFQ